MKERWKKCIKDEVVGWVNIIERQKNEGMKLDEWNNERQNWSVDGTNKKGLKEG